MTVVNTINTLQAKHRTISGVETAPDKHPGGLNTSELPLAITSPGPAESHQHAVGLFRREREYIVRVYVMPVAQGEGLNEGWEAIQAILDAFLAVYWSDITLSGAVDFIDRIEDEGHVILPYGETRYHGLVFHLFIVEKATVAQMITPLLLGGDIFLEKAGDTMTGNLDMNSRSILDVYSVVVQDYLVHAGDSSTFFSFVTGGIKFEAGGIGIIQFVETGQDAAIGNYDNLDVDLRWDGWTDDSIFVIDALDQTVILPTLAAAWDMNNQAVTNANIDSGVITGITDLAVADGGTGASDAATARTNLGLVAAGAGDIWVEKAGDTMTGVLNMGDNNITNVGSIDLDLIRADAASGSVTIELDNAAGADLLVGNNNALVVEGDNDRVGILTNAPATALDVRGFVTTEELWLTHQDGIYGKLNDNLFINCRANTAGEGLALQINGTTGLFLELSGNVGIGLIPTANMAGLSIEAGLLTLKETTTPTADADYGKIYTKADNVLYFQDGAGVEHALAYA